jgi:hypothetical protein
MPRKAQLRGLIAGIATLVDERLEEQRLRDLFSSQVCKTEIDLNWTLAH